MILYTIDIFVPLLTSGNWAGEWFVHVSIFGISHAGIGTEVNKVRDTFFQFYPDFTQNTGKILVPPKKEYS